jgi:DNA-binding beta-propeller fold protein YncE
MNTNPLRVVLAAALLSLAAPAARADFLVSNFDSGAGFIARLDQTTGASLGNFAFGTQPIYMAFGPDGNLYVSNLFNNNVVRFDGKTGAPSGSSPRAEA